MMKDWTDMPVTAGSTATVGGINHFVEGLLAYETRAAAILKAADDDPDSTLANAYAAVFCMFLESRSAPAMAAPYIARADAAAGNATERERMVLEAVRAWTLNDIQHAVALSEDLATRYPRELAMAKVCQYHYFNLGDAPGMLRIANKITPANAQLPYVHGMAAFAFEQAHMLGDAEKAARRAIALKRKEPWAQHALAHVFLTQGHTAEARAFLDDVKDTWTDLNSVMYTHSWWHMALLMIDQGDTGAVLDLYDRSIWGVAKEYSQDQIGAVSMLARLELAGIAVGNRWADVGQYLKVRVDDHVQPFLSLQYVYGLGRAALPEADPAMAGVRAFAQTVPDFVRASWTEVAVPACEGLLAHARGDHEEAVRALGPVLPRLAEIGGSHAQRDLFDQIWLDALIRSNRLGHAQRLLEQRREASPQAQPVIGQLKAVYERLGLPDEAARVAVRAREAASRV